MTRPKPKTVRAWCFSEAMDDGRPHVFETFDTREIARDYRIRSMRSGWRCGPVTRIEVPAPKERKR